MTGPSGAQPSTRFGDFEFAPRLRRLERSGVVVDLSSRAMDVLAVLVERPGEVITKQELLARAWPQATVVEGALRVAMVALRRALGDDAGEDGRQYITTVPGRGYRFVGDVEALPTRGGGLDPAKPVPRTLPARPMKVVGRDAVIEALLRQLEGQRFVTLVGPGGIGKTTVALSAAHDWVAARGGGVVFIDLGELGSDRGEGVSEVLCAKLGLARLGADPTDSAIAHLRLNPTLIVLDTCEGVVDAAARLAETVVASAKGVRVLATSREALRAEGEIVSRIGPLATPAAGQDLTAQEALKFPAVQLFVQRAIANDLGFEFGDEQASVIGAICRELDGIALAIELAAGRVDAFGLQQVANLLATEFALTWPGRRTAAPRQQTLRATLNWSYALLGPVERAVFLRLCVFVGPLSLEAAIAVCAEDTGPAMSEVVDALASLVAKSLVNAVLDGTTPRFRMLDTTRAYAQAKLVEAGDEPATRRRHAMYYRDRLQRAEAEAPLRPAAEWLGDYAMEVGNLRGALDWAFSQAGDGSVGVALTAAAIPLWLRLSLLDECGSRATQALGFVTSLETSDPREAMRLHSALGASAPNAVEMAAAFTKVLEIAEILDDPEHKLRALRGLQYQGHWTNHFRAALSFAQRFHDLAMSQSNPNDRRLGERLLGSVKSDLGDLAGARRHLEAVLAGASDHGQTAARFDDDIRFQNDGQVAARVFLSAVLWRQGFSDQAVRMAELGVAEAQAIGHAGTECLALALASCPLALCTGDLAAAADFTKLLVGLSTKHGLPQWAPYGARFRRAIGLQGGDVSGIEGADQSDVHLRSLTVATVLVDALATAGRGAEGLAMLDEFAAQVPELGGFASEFSRLRGELLLLQTAPGAAKPSEDLFRAALEIAQAQGALGLALRAATSLARLLRHQGRPVEAIACLQPIHVRFTEGFDTVDFTSAKRLLDDLAVAGRT